jgi:threonine synthase
LQEELARGAQPFTCQGNLNGLAIEGGETLGYEMISALASTGLELDDLVVQVGGGALASSCMQSFAEALSLGAISGRPRIHTVQTTGAHPLERAYRRVCENLPRSPSVEEIDRALRIAATHRSAYMWPWESEPRSVATGILDDETYDWRAVVGGMLATGGQPSVVSESLLVEAHGLGAEAGFHADPTGSSGLAGLIDLRHRGVVGPEYRVAVLFTGTER